jgi:hypothetical protein
MRFSRALRTVVKGRWSGELLVASPEHETAGTAVFGDGRIAWATSRTQQETLGSFLRRLGHLTADDLDIVQAQYEACQGKMKLGRLLETAGMMPARALRRCLSMHVRLAVGTLVDPTFTVADLRPGRLCDVEDNLFDLVEILPELFAQPAGSADRLPTGPGDAVTVVLESLKGIPGHSCSLVSDDRGRVIAVRGLNDTDVPGPSVLAATAVTLPGPSVLAATAVTLLETAMHSATWSQLGTADFASAEGSAGALLAHWLDPGRSVLAAVLLTPGGKVGIARHELATAAAAFTRGRTQLTENGEYPWHR